MSKSKSGVGTKGTYDSLKFASLSSDLLNAANQIQSDHESFTVSCFFRAETQEINMKWKQGSLILNPDSITWTPFWRNRNTPVEISETIQIIELSIRPMSKREALLRFKPHFSVIRGVTHTGFVEFVVPDLDVALVVHRLRVTYGESMILDPQLQQTIRNLRDYKAIRSLEE